jgi:branched-chain amino acid transport system ATP-binding protein
MSGAVRRRSESFPTQGAAAAGDLGGQHRTLAFATAYMVRSGLCLIDEQSIGLAPKIARPIGGRVERFAAHEMAILLVEHIGSAVAALSPPV